MKRENGRDGTGMLTSWLLHRCAIFPLPSSNVLKPSFTFLSSKTPIPFPSAPFASFRHPKLSFPSSAIAPLSSQTRALPTAESKALNELVMRAEATKKSKRKEKREGYHTDNFINTIANARKERRESNNGIF
jgi:hypothetical protein